jgi:hypothetical protein
MPPRMIAPWQLVPAGNLRKSSYLDTQDERPQRRSAGEGDLGPFQRAAGLGEDANCPLPIHLRSGDQTSKM